MATGYRELLVRLHDQRVEFVLIGGVAAVIHGSGSEEVEAFGVTLRVVTLDGLIHLKRAAGRPKDLESIAELEALRDERDRPSGCLPPVSDR
jgi:predicted nucleotidyltransferase